MIKFENTETYGWEAAIRGMRNPMNSWNRMDSKIEVVRCDDFAQLASMYYVYPHIGPNDLQLMKNLRKAGTDHRKYLRQIVIWVDITAPLYWWKEAETYRVGVASNPSDIEWNSCSTMHKIHAKEFTLDDFSHEHLGSWVSGDCEMPNLRFPIDELIRTIHALNDYRDEYLKVDAKIRSTKQKWTESELKELTELKKFWWWQMIQLLPDSYNQKRTVMINYEVCNNIYGSRKNHKQDEWREGFMDWMRKELPYSKELIFGEE